MYNLGLSAILWEIMSSNAWWFVCSVMRTLGFKCQLSGDSPQGSWSSINDVSHSGFVCCYPNPISVTYILFFKGESDIREHSSICCTQPHHAGEAIIMLLGNYENFANVVAENIIKTRCIRIK